MTDARGPDCYESPLEAHRRQLNIMKLRNIALRDDIDEIIDEAIKGDSL